MEKNINMGKITETLGDAVKLAANLSEATKKDPMRNISDNSNNTQSNPNQTVQIQISDKEKETADKKPVIIREKPETHIHHDFPEGRALTDKECELSLKKAEMENRLKEKEMEYQSYREDQERHDRLIHEEQERKEREERRIRNEKRAKVRGIVVACLAALGIGVIGYSVYKDSKNGGGNATIHFSTNPVQGEGKVE